MLKSRSSALLPGLLVLVILSGCSSGPGPGSDPTQGSSGGVAPPAGTQASNPPPAPDPGSPGAPASGVPGTPADPNSANPAALEVTIYTANEKFVVNEFRIDLPKMRNVYVLLGFFPDQWDKVEMIPFTEIREFQILDVVDETTFERLYRDRQELQLNAQEIFRVMVTSMNGDTFDYITVIPRFRGYKDGLRWDLPMAGNPHRIQRVVFFS
jgi:hypothetical protein